MCIYMIVKHFVYIIEIPKGTQNPWEYARNKLNIPDEEITPWGEVVFSNGVAKINYDF